MLTEIRDRATGWFAGAIAALIIIPMAFWGIGDYAPEGADPLIIEVGEQKITQQAYQQQLANAQAQALQNNPSLANSDVFSSDLYKQQVLDRMINTALTQDIANEQNYLVGDKELARALKTNQLFQTDGKFDTTAYENFVISRSESKTQFENQVRENTRTYQVQAGYQESALVLPDEVRSLLEIQVEERDFDLITIKQSDYIDGITVSEADINEYYQSNVANFMHPDRVSISYISLGIDSVTKDVTLNDEDVKAIYENDIERYRSRETRETSHILLPTGGDESDSNQLEKAQSLVTQLRGGADFAELAKEHSKDPGSASNGGSLGEVEPGAMVPEFDRATFALAQGAISEPVKSQFGYHIIKVDEIIGGIVQSFDEVKVEIETAERKRLAQDILIERVELLRNLVFEQPESLDGIASELGLTVQKTGLFEKDIAGQGILANANIRNAAFSEQVLTEGYNSEPIESTSNNFIALRKLEFREAEPKSLESVSTIIKTQLTNQRASEAAENAGDSILEKAKTNWSDLTSDESINVESITISLTDQERKANNDVLSEVFRAQLDGTTQKIISFTDQSGDFNVVRLKSITPGDVDKVSDQIKESTRRLVASRNGSSLFQSYLQGLTKELKSSIDSDLL